MGISRIGYFNTFYGGSTTAGSGTKKMNGYLGKYEESLTPGQEQDKDGLLAKQENVKTGQTEVIRGMRLRDHLSGKDDQAPYYFLSEDGIIDYNGVIFVCDTEHNQLHLGDTSDSKNCLTIPLSKGGSLVVNRNNIDQLSKAISMFSPEDINLIMRALAVDAKARQTLEEIEDEECSVGEEISEGEENGTEKGVNNDDGVSVLETVGSSGEWRSEVYQSMTYEKKD